jgi:hypothetical protein
VDWGLVSVVGGSTPGGGVLRPASGGGLGPTTVPVPTRLGRGRGGTTGGGVKLVRRSRRRAAQRGR